MRSAFLCVISHGSGPQFPHQEHGGNRDVSVSPSAMGGHKPRRAVASPHSAFQMLAFLGRAPTGGPASPAIVVPSRPQPGGSPESAVLRRPAAWSARTSPLGRPPRRADGRGWRAGCVSCCYLSLMTRSVPCWQHSLLPLHATSFNHCN